MILPVSAAAPWVEWHSLTIRSSDKVGTAHAFGLPIHEPDSP